MIYKEKLGNSIVIIRILKPNVIFLTGKSCSGKSFLSNELSNEYNILELDKIVRKLGKKYNIGKAPDYAWAFPTYHI
jgi:predicted kinase